MFAAQQMKSEVERRFSAAVYNISASRRSELQRTAELASLRIKLEDESPRTDPGEGRDGIESPDKLSRRFAAIGHRTRNRPGTWTPPLPCLGSGQLGSQLAGAGTREQTAYWEKRFGLSN